MYIKFILIYLYYFVLWFPAVFSHNLVVVVFLIVVIALFKIVLFLKSIFLLLKGVSLVTISLFCNVDDNFVIIQGLIHKCRYSLGSIAMWRQQDDVHTLQPGHMTMVTTTRNMEYYRLTLKQSLFLFKIAWTVVFGAIVVGVIYLFRYLRLK